MNLSKFSIHFIILLISLFGLVLRSIDYDTVPPFMVTGDEFAYPWAGMTLLQTGTPKAWSWFNAYKTAEMYFIWGHPIRIVSPWINQPPLYSLIIGKWVLLNGIKNIFDVRLSLIRVIPIFFSFFTMVLIGLFTYHLLGKRVALVATGLYALTPVVVLSNRVSVVENLLTPIVLLSLYFYGVYRRNLRITPLIILGILNGLAILTKNVGIALPILFLSLFIWRKNFFHSFIFGVIIIIFAAVHPLMGYYYDWNIFINVLRELQQIHALSDPPNLVQTIFRFPIIGNQWDKLFFDGSILAGFILLFASPFWIKTVKFPSQNKSELSLLIGFPFIYLGILTLIVSGGTYSFFGWYVYPIFPFLMILLAKSLYDLWQKPDVLQASFFYLILGSSTIRFFLLIRPEFQKSWQTILGLFLLISVGGFISKTKYQRLILAVFFAIFLIVNVLVIINLNQIYPGAPQPLQ